MSLVNDLQPEGKKRKKKNQQRTLSNSDKRRGDPQKCDNIFSQRLELTYKPKRVARIPYIIWVEWCAVEKKNCGTLKGDLN